MMVVWMYNPYNPAHGLSWCVHDSYRIVKSGFKTRKEAIAWIAAQNKEGKHSHEHIANGN